MVHTARNAVLTGEWIRDYNRDLYVFPLMNWLTWLAYQLVGPGFLASFALSVLMGTATVGAIAWGLKSALGQRGAVYAALLGATSFWLAVYARIPVAENMAALLMALACVAAMRRSGRALAGAGALGVGAVLFAKYHAVGFLPALVAFVLLRERSWRRSWPLFAGGAVVFLVWLAFIFLPNREFIVGHVGQQSTGLHGSMPFALSFFDGLAEIYNTLRRSWVLFRMPVVAILGGFCALWVVGNGEARRRRLADGSAVFAFWFVSQWLYYSLLPYKAPRYYVLVAVPLVACAAVQFTSLATSGDRTLRAPARWDEHLPVAVWLYSLAFGCLDGAKHYASMLLEYLSLPPARISDETFTAVVEIFRGVDTFKQNLAWAAGIFAVVYVFFLWHPEILSRLGLKRGVIPGAWVRGLTEAALVVLLVSAAFQFGWWWTHRTYYVHDIKSSLTEMIGPDAVLIGPLAPLLTQDTRMRSLPYFGPAGEKGLLEKYGVTHAVVCGQGDSKELEERYPGLQDEMTIVQAWPLRTLFSGSLEIHRLPAIWDGVRLHDYQPTLFEQGAAAAAAEDWEGAIAKFDEHRAAGGRAIPELISLEAVCWFRLGVTDRSRRLLLDVIRQRPNDPLNYQNLGVLCLKEGDRAGALSNWVKALRLDPKNRDLEDRIRELLR